ncbi:MAG: CsbD family protein [Anaerolineaceae bacterium]|jgi:uncharacterized protein YjbJ (UPF0337 family)
MNDNISKGKWKQIRGQTKVWWGKLTGNGRTRFGGRFDKLVGSLQEKYGNAQQQAGKNTKRGKND